MQILITSQEKLRIGLNGPISKITDKFGVAFEYCDIQNSIDLYNLTWRYKVQDEKKFLLACIKHGIIYKRYDGKGN